MCPQCHNDINVSVILHEDSGLLDTNSTMTEKWCYVNFLRSNIRSFG